MICLLFPALGNHIKGFMKNSAEWLLEIGRKWEGRLSPGSPILFMWVVACKVKTLFHLVIHPWIAVGASPDFSVIFVFSSEFSRIKKRSEKSESLLKILKSSWYINKWRQNTNRVHVSWCYEIHTPIKFFASGEHGCIVISIGIPDAVKL